MLITVCTSTGCQNHMVLGREHVYVELWIVTWETVVTSTELFSHLDHRSGLHAACAYSLNHPALRCGAASLPASVCALSPT